MKQTGKTSKSVALTYIGLLVMAALILTKLIPSTNLAGYSVFVGIAFFFIVEGVGKTPPDESGLQFTPFIKDLKKPWVIPLMLLPMVSAIGTLIVGDLIFKGGFTAHVLGRTSSMLSFDKIPLLVFQVVIAAFGEEIAWRGFFVGKSMKLYPFWLCAIVSSVLFSAGHIATGDFGLVLFDVSTIFIDSMIYAVLYKKTGNCLVSTAAHIICNATGIIATFALK